MCNNVVTPKMGIETSAIYVHSAIPQWANSNGVAIVLRTFISTYNLLIISFAEVLEFISMRNGRQRN